MQTEKLQIGVVVEDLEKAIDKAEQLFAIRPWRTMDVPEAGVRAAIADWSGVEIELIAESHGKKRRMIAMSQHDSFHLPPQQICAWHEPAGEHHRQFDMEEDSNFVCGLEGFRGWSHRVVANMVESIIFSQSKLLQIVFLADRDHPLQRITPPH